MSIWIEETSETKRLIKYNGGQVVDMRVGSVKFYDLPLIWLVCVGGWMDGGEEQPLHPNPHPATLPHPTPAQLFITRTQTVGRVQHVNNDVSRQLNSPCSVPFLAPA